MLKAWTPSLASDLAATDVAGPIRPRRRRAVDGRNLVFAGARMAASWPMPPTPAAYSHPSTPAPPRWLRDDYEVGGVQYVAVLQDTRQHHVLLPRHGRDEPANEDRILGVEAGGRRFRCRPFRCRHRTPNRRLASGSAAQVERDAPFSPTWCSKCHSRSERGRSRRTCRGSAEGRIDRRL